jgi:hypothetical protein
MLGLKLIYLPLISVVKHYLAWSWSYLASCLRSLLDLEMGYLDDCVFTMFFANVHHLACRHLLNCECSKGITSHGHCLSTISISCSLGLYIDWLFQFLSLNTVRHEADYLPVDVCFQFCP